MMVFESSTTPVARQLKLLVYGGAGTGKTWFAIHAPSPLIIDTESSTDPYRGQPNLPPFTVAKNARPSEIAATLEQFASLGYIPNGRERLQPETLVIDSFTILWLVAQEAGQKIAEGRARKNNRPTEAARLAFGDWSLIKRPIQRLYTQLLNLPVHVIVTARQKDIYDDTASEPRKVGEAPDIERNAVYNFDLVLKLELDEKGRRTGLVEKSRFADFPPGTRLPDPSWATFAHLARAGETPSRNIDLEATAEQEARRMEPPAPAEKNGQNGRRKGPRAEWTRSPANRQRTLEWLAENGLSEADANAALGIDDWRKTSLSAEDFKAAIEDYVANQLAGGDASDDGEANDVPDVTPDESPAPATKSTPRASSKTAPESAPQKCANCGVDDARPGSKYCQTCADLLFASKLEDETESDAETAKTE